MGIVPRRGFSNASVVSIVWRLVFFADDRSFPNILSDAIAKSTQSHARSELIVEHPSPFIVGFDQCLKAIVQGE